MGKKKNMPVVQDKKEPMLLLDVTGSMNYQADVNDPTTSRADVVQEALKVVVARLASEDTAGETEAGGGGLRTITFAGGFAHDLGDINPSNFAAKWGSIHFSGGTRIMPGLALLLKTYTAEFGSDSATKLLAVVITDGEADDEAEFESQIRKAAGNMYVVVGIVGYGPEHDSALAAYKRMAETNPNVQAFSLGNTTDPNVVAETLLRMIA